jgi:hypothetical protein
MRIRTAGDAGGRLAARCLLSRKGLDGERVVWLRVTAGSLGGGDRRMPTRVTYYLVI